MIVLLATRDQARNGTAVITTWSGIFADKSTLKLDETERNVFEMVKSMPQTWSCGCVIGYPEDVFSPKDLEAFERHGIGKRFSI